MAWSFGKQVRLAGKGTRKGLSVSVAHLTFSGMTSMYHRSWLFIYKLGAELGTLFL